MFEACFVITEECNMSCEYCYMSNRKRLMSRDTFDFHHENTLPYFMKHYNETEYALDIFGGEPLTYWPMITHIINKTKDDPKRKAINLMTNGLLLNKKRVDYLMANHVNVSLSFDGLWAQQLGKYRSLRPLLSKAFKKCSVCITPRHMNMAENFRFLVDEFDIIPSFKIVRDDIWSNADVEKFKLELDKLEQIYFDYQIMPNLLQHRLDMLIESTKHKIKQMRCFVGHNGAAFAANGKVYPCARFLTNDQLPLHDGHVVEKNLTKIDGIASSFKECVECELEDHCDFICSYEEMKHGGIINNVCEIYKAIELKALEIYEKSEAFYG